MSEKENLLPATTDAPKCPFYGFHHPQSPGFEEVLISTGGNQCPLVSLSRSKRGETHFSPCYMEVAGKNPNWKSCLYNQEKLRHTLEEHTEEIRIIPEASQTAVTFADWYSQIMGEKLNISQK